MPTGVAPVPTHRMTGAQFWLFQESGPDHERRELVKGTPMMMVPPTIANQRIADNLTRRHQEKGSCGSPSSGASILPTHSAGVLLIDPDR